MTANWYQLEDIASVIVPDAWRAYREVFDPVDAIYRREMRHAHSTFEATGKSGELMAIQAADADAIECHRALEESFAKMHSVERPARIILKAAIAARIDEIGGIGDMP